MILLLLVLHYQHSEVLLKHEILHAREELNKLEVEPEQSKAILSVIYKTSKVTQNYDFGAMLYIMALLRFITSDDAEKNAASTRRKNEA